MSRWETTRLKKHGVRHSLACSLAEYMYMYMYMYTYTYMYTYMYMYMYVCIRSRPTARVTQLQRTWEFPPLRIKSLLDSNPPKSKLLVGGLGGPSTLPPRIRSEGGMLRLEALIELKFLNYSFSSSNFSIRAFRAYPLTEARQAATHRAIRGSSISVNRTPPPLNPRRCARGPWAAARAGRLARAHRRSWQSAGRTPPRTRCPPTSSRTGSRHLYITTIAMIICEYINVCIIVTLALMN